MEIVLILYDFISLYYYGIRTHDFSSLASTSALGSSGLTTGPYIAYLLAQYFNHPEISWDSSIIQKDIKNYINIEKTGN
ncbi:hypothetical protein [Lactococcus lactis]|uniref:hypothetical protein n=1 Tax=Lactococcus lactis TaxID=1358 RepID=UPI00374FC39E